jgi:myo-inositol-1(or 4)-monophosphatase
MIKSGERVRRFLLCEINNMTENTPPTIHDIEILARQAGAILAAGFRRDNKILSKTASIDLVTEVDQASEAFLLREIQARFPSHRILAEEGGAQTGEIDHLWIIDPLDGTVNFAHGIAVFSVSIAYAYKGKVMLGVVYDPVQDECFSGVRGEGAWANGVPLHVSDTQELGRALLATGFPYDSWTTKLDNLDHHGNFMKRTRGVRRLGSAALDVCYVAAGRFDGYWEFKTKAWDVGAAALIAEEAGATVTTIAGDEDYLAPVVHLLVANETLHAKMREVLQLGRLEE